MSAPKPLEFEIHPRKMLNPRALFRKYYLDPRGAFGMFRTLHANLGAANLQIDPTIRVPL